MRKYLDANIIANTKDMPKEMWLQKRKCGIGGSDASSILGFNPYKSSMSVYLDKIDEIRYGNINNTQKEKHIAQTSNSNKDSSLKEKVNAKNSYDKFDKDLKEDYVYIDNKNNYKMELSNKLKGFVASEFMLRTGKKVRSINGILRNDKYPFAIANIDRAVVGEKAFLECKVTNSFNKKEWTKSVPIHYQIQMNHYMAVSGASYCYVAVLIGNEELVIHKLERDKDLIDEIMKLEKMFWNNCILGDELPMPDGSSDYSKTLDTLYKDSKCEEIILFEAEKILDRYDEVVKIYKDFEKEKKSIEQYLKLQMKNYEIAYVGDRKITWKKQERNTIDTTKLKKEHPEIVAQFIKTTTSRVLKL